MITPASPGIKVKQARRDALMLMGLATLVMVLLALMLRMEARDRIMDFEVPFDATRCLIHGQDPYILANLIQTDDRNRPAFEFVYLPTIFPVTAPLALLPFGWASLIWTLATCAGLIFGSFLLWRIAADSAPLLAGTLIAFILANSFMLVAVGNPTGIAIGLCLLAAWCFYRDQYLFFGVICLGLSLLIKPQNACFVWLYFFLAGPRYRKLALQAAMVVLVVGVPATLWANHVAPHWLSELQTTLKVSTMRGGIDDPGPSSGGGHGFGMLINLQTVLSTFRDDPHFYNSVTYLICGALLLVWVITTVRASLNPRSFWLGLASISALTTIPIYHRLGDAKLMILAVPACAMLWAEGSKAGRWAVAVVAVAFFWTGDFPWLIVLTVIQNTVLSNSGLTRQMVGLVQVLPAPLALLVAGIALLWIYARSDRFPCTQQD